MPRSVRSLTLSFAAAAAAAAACLVWLSATPLTARSQPDLSPRQQPQDLGPTSPATIVTASLVLKVRDPQGLEALTASMQDPRSPAFHRFLSADEFADRFSPGMDDIASITGYLHQFGIIVNDVYPNRLLMSVSGPTDAFNRAFDLDVHDFVKGQHHYHRPHHTPRVPTLFRDLLVTIVGPSDDAEFRPAHNRAAYEKFGLTPPLNVLPQPGTIATNTPGEYTVGDVANRYDINPLYQAHIDGAGRTLGIVTLADFLPNDAYAYWNLIGLPVAPNRITQIRVDGGAVLSSAAGAGETSLDVEQSGGLAPGAAIRVYDAPNSSVGFMDAFYRSISENQVDTLSTSWGSAEEFYAEAVVGVDRTGELLAFHQIFLEAGAQGISVFASTGDSGAFDINDAFNDPVDNVLSVDVPASDPAITGAGGTTTPLILSLGPGTPNLVVSREQVWGWDYIENYLVGVLGSSFEHSQFPGGTGGGVSVVWSRPSYQTGMSGLRKTEPGQSVVFQGTDLLDLPAHFSGRNLPDVSLDADPYSGYLLLSTLDGGLLDGFGGTSFVSPQLNGISALLTQATHGRVGFWNPALYRAAHDNGHNGPGALVDIIGGDNWFYAGVKGYEPGAGLGVLDVARWAQVVGSRRQ